MISARERQRAAEESRAARPCPARPGPAPRGRREASAARSAAAAPRGAGCGDAALLHTGLWQTTPGAGPAPGYERGPVQPGMPRAGPDGHQLFQLRAWPRSDHPARPARTPGTACSSPLSLPGLLRRHFLRQRIVFLSWKRAPPWPRPQGAPWGRPSQQRRSYWKLTASMCECPGSAGERSLAGSAWPGHLESPERLPHARLCARGRPPQVPRGARLTRARPRTGAAIA